MNNQILCSDIDGTLISDSKRVAPQDIQALATWQKHGHLFGITSGRSLDGIKMITRQLEREPDFIVALNGAYVSSITRHIYESNISKVMSRRVLEIVRQLPSEKITVNINRQSRQLVQCVTNGHTEVDEMSLLQQLEDGLEIAKITVLLKLSDDSQLFYEQLSSLPVEITTSDDRYIEIMQQGISKLGGLTTALEQQIPLERVIAIGDYLNDIAMIKSVGAGYAVANARPELKQVADYQTVSHNDGPISHILNEQRRMNR
ncbi:Cof-type HAD-IIB family hydrolase [Lactiplantibacillus paraplantarum]|uniref:Cof-type HAD-IIB family hydrolase n=1 Tax=Lactiplantibacillus paraplantarum TaxID=60520 RepID=UPI00148AFC38|nr:Cof-type HAD-IIB family hydrolase [Lactiplantibacillus paraplantarum]QJU50893.1 putative phosphatase YcsE [Lactiplantibacillus paraplantarum]UKB40388.1 HAD family hydrolase [Lactiplantibacillus paraplantarum]